MFPFRTDPEDRPWLLGLALLAFCQGVILFFFGWFGAGGHFMFPLDDSYIHLQYAKRLAEGFPLSYTPGMAPSGGMTSPLYVLLLSPLFLLGLEGARAAFMACLFGLLCWMLLPVWTYQLARRLSNGLCGAVAALLVLANGHLLWNFFSGMETGLFTLLLIGAVLGAQVWWQDEERHGRAMMLACLAALPLVRPEGAVLTAVAVLVVLARRGEQPRMSLPLLLLCLAPFAGWLGILLLATGDWRPAGLVVKGLFGNVHLDTFGKLAIAFDNLVAIVFRFHANVVPDPAYAAFKGTDTLPYMAPGMGLLAFFGAGLLLVGEWRAGRLRGGIFLAAAWILGLASIAASLLPFVHQQRYLAPFTVPAIILAVTAVRRIAQVFHQLQDTVMRGAGAALLLLSLPSLGFWAAEYGRNSRDIYHLLRVATFSIGDEGRPIGITDAGVLAYYTGRPAVDLVGLGSREFAPRFIQGDGAALAGLEVLPHEIRPDLLVTYREWFHSSFPLGPPEWTVSIPHTSITSGATLGAFPIYWDEVEAARLPPGHGGRVLQEVNVAELDSEEASAHRYEIGLYDADALARPQPLSPVARFTVPSTLPMDVPTTLAVALSPRQAVDGGRVMRREQFRLRPRFEPRGGALLWILRAGVPPAPHPFGPAPRALALSARSDFTGYTARRVVGLEGGEDAGLLIVDLADMLDEAGGESWTLSVEAADPPGAAFATYRHWIFEPSPPSEERTPRP